jgi:hypothetical protein
MEELKEKLEYAVLDAVKEEIPDNEDMDAIALRLFTKTSGCVQSFLLDKVEEAEQFTEKRKLVVDDSLREVPYFE